MILPEALLSGKERILIEWFFNKKTANAMATFMPADIDEYVKACSSLRGFAACSGIIAPSKRTCGKKQKLFGIKIKTPVLALGGDVGSAPNIYELMKALCETVTGGQIVACDHYIPEEQPEGLANELMTFLGRASVDRTRWRHSRRPIGQASHGPRSG